MIYKLAEVAERREAIRMREYAQRGTPAAQLMAGWSERKSLAGLEMHVGVLHLKPTTVDVGFPTYDVLLMYMHPNSHDAPAAFSRLARVAHMEREHMFNTLGPLQTTEVKMYIEYLERCAQLFGKLGSATGLPDMRDAESARKSLERMLQESLDGHEAYEISGLFNRIHLNGPPRYD